MSLSLLNHFPLTYIYVYIYCISTSYKVYIYIRGAFKNAVFSSALRRKKLQFPFRFSVISVYHSRLPKISFVKEHKLYPDVYCQYHSTWGVGFKMLDVDLTNRKTVKATTFAEQRWHYQLLL